MDNQNNLYFSCHFVENSTARGCLAITKQAVENTQPQFTYKIVYKAFDSESTISSSLQGLYFGKAEVFLHEIDQNGLPAKHPALHVNISIPLIPTANQSQSQGIYYGLSFYCIIGLTIKFIGLQFP